MKTYLKILIISLLTGCAGVQNSNTKKNAPTPQGWEKDAQPGGDGTLPISFSPKANLPKEGTTLISILTPEIHQAVKLQGEEKSLKTIVKGKTINFAKSENYMTTYISTPIQVNDQNAIANLVVSKPNLENLDARKKEFFNYISQFN